MGVRKALKESDTMHRSPSSTREIILPGSGALTDWLRLRIAALSLRPGRRHQWPGTRHPEPAGYRHRRRHPDRRGHQPRQQRRPAPGLLRRRHRRQHRHLHQLGHLCGRRLCDPHRHGATGRAAADRGRRGQAGVAQDRGARAALLIPPQLTTALLVHHGLLGRSKQTFLN